jgi:CubicO group peptidase (beta-lactamase class C family)
MTASNDVTRVGGQFEADPDLAGLDTAALERLEAALLRDISQGNAYGTSMIVARRGHIGYHATLGAIEPDGQRLTRPTDRYMLMSTTKSFTAVAVLQLIERGQLSFDTRVAEVIPEFAQRGKERIAVSHLLTHTAGIYTGFEGPHGMANTMEPGDMDAAIAALVPWPIAHRPGRRVVYTPWEGYGVLGEIVRRLDPQGRRYQDYLRDEIFVPLGMTQTSLGLQVGHPDRVPVNLMPDTRTGNAQPSALFDAMNLADESCQIPAGNGFSTATDVYRFADALRRGGANDAGRILSPALVSYAFRNHTGELVNEFWDFNREMADMGDFPANFTYGGGYARGCGDHLTPLGKTASPTAFCAVGSGSTCWMVDPERDLTVVFLTSGLMQGLSHFKRLERINDLALASAV